MRFLICPDSFKGSLTALEAARALQRGLCDASSSIDCDLAPLADGGEGFVDAMLAGGGRQVYTQVTDPLGRQVRAAYGLLPDGCTAVVEMASAAGLELLDPEALRPLEATTYGVGELMRAALDVGAKRLIIGIGGSATTDGGAGMAQALGARLLDSTGRPVGCGGAALAGLSEIQLEGVDSRLREAEILVACDVDNPLTGPAGAAVVYGPQKGASAADVALLDGALERFAEVVNRDLGVNVRDIPGAGAAGGLGAGLVAFCGARLLPGIEVVAEALTLRDRIRQADWIITGEGCTDAQTLSGKAVAGVLKLAKSENVPCIVLSGAVQGEIEALYGMGAACVLSVSDGPRDIASAMAEAGVLVEKSARALGGLLVASAQNGCGGLNQ